MYEDWNQTWMHSDCLYEYSTPTECGFVVEDNADWSLSFMSCEDYDAEHDAYLETLVEGEE